MSLLVDEHPILEGLPANEDRVEFVLPVVTTLGQAKPRTVKLRDDVDFKREGPKPALGEVPAQLVRFRLVVDWYPKIQAQRSRGADGGAAVKHEGKLGAEHLAFLDWDGL